MNSKLNPRCTELALLLIVCLTMPGCIGIFASWGKESTAISSGEEAAYWGKPDRIEMDEAGSGRELWIYRWGEFRWQGIVLLAIVPIPLVVPVGHDEIVHVVEEGRVLSYVYRQTVSWGRVCEVGLFPHVSELGFHCHAATTPDHSLRLHDSSAAREQQKRKGPKESQGFGYPLSND